MFIYIVHNMSRKQTKYFNYIRNLWVIIICIHDSLQRIYIYIYISFRKLTTQHPLKVTLEQHANAALGLEQLIHGHSYNELVTTNTLPIHSSS